MSTLIRLIFTLGLLVASGLTQAGEAGRIVFATGHADVSGHTAMQGDAVQEGADLVTGADGYIYLKTIDSGFLILRPGTHARIVTYHIDTQVPANTRVKLELLSGVARAISGQGVKHSRQNFRFNTPVAAIGVRGTDFTVFTDQETSRVTVLTGGVIVSGFSAACGPEGNGPCEGSTSRELFENQANQLLQIQKGQLIPQLLRNSGLSPDLKVPPRSDEPSGKTSTASSAPLAAADVSLEPQKSDSLLASTKLPLPPPPPPPVQPPPQVPPVPVVDAPEVIWGRWTQIANLAPDSELLAKVKTGEYIPATVIQSFFVSRVKDSGLVLPSQGKVAFGLTNSETYIQAAGQDPVVAAVQDPRLEVDFTTRGFSTSMNVVAPAGQVNVYAKGDVTLNGEFVSDITRSNSVIRGYLGGSQAKEAGYIFKSIDSTALTAFGAARWTR